MELRNIGSFETAAQLLARKSARQRSGDFGLPFLEDVKANAVIELVGLDGTGKTQILIQMIVSTILPKRLGGMEVGAVVLDTDLRFPFVRLVTILEAQIRAAMATGGSATAAVAGSGPSSSSTSASASSTASSRDADVRREVVACLDRVILMQTRTSTELLAALHAVWGLLEKDPAISLVCIDSISAYYWQDRSAAGDLPTEATLTQRGVIKALAKLQADFPVVVAVTKPALYTHREGYRAEQQQQQAHLPPELCFRDHMCKEWFQFVTHKLIVGAGGGSGGAAAAAAVGGGGGGGGAAVAGAKGQRPPTQGVIYRKNNPVPVPFAVTDTGVAFGGRR